MSSSSERKLKEKQLLIKKVFPTPYPRVPTSQSIFQLCRTLGGPYCSRFKENGYNDKFEGFKPEEVVAEAAKMLSDDDLLTMAADYKDVLNSWGDFKGEYYTYDHKTKQLRIGSEWPRLERELVSFRAEYGNGGIAVLSAILEVNVDHDKRWRNYYIVQTLAKKKGLGKGWFAILSDLQLGGIAVRDKGDIYIPEERVPFVEVPILAANLTLPAGSRLVEVD